MKPVITVLLCALALASCADLPPVPDGVHPLPSFYHYQGLKQVFESLDRPSLIPAVKIDPRLPELLSAYGIDVPEGTNISAGTVANGTSFSAFYRFTPRVIRGRIIVVPGLSHHVGYAVRFINTFTALGYEIWCVDLPGQGLSGGESAAVDDFSSYSRTLYEVISLFPESGDGIPAFTLGHSTGCTAIMRYFTDYPDDAGRTLKGAILCAPLVRPVLWSFSDFMYQGLKDVLVALPAFDRPTSHDPYRSWLKSHDPIGLRSLSVSWVGALKNNITLFASHPGQLDSPPILIIQGQGDDVVDWRKNIPEIQRLFTNTSLIMLSEAMHDLPLESPRYFDQVVSEAESFMNEHTH